MSYRELVDVSRLMQARGELLCTRRNQIKAEVSDTNGRLARVVVVVVIVVVDDDDDDDYVDDYDYNKKQNSRYFDSENVNSSNNGRILYTLTVQFSSFSC